MEQLPTDDGQLYGEIALYDQYARRVLLSQLEFPRDALVVLTIIDGLTRRIRHLTRPGLPNRNNRRGS